jgi:apolipoprotein D and lipocalin family protein
LPLRRRSIAATLSALLIVLAAPATPAQSASAVPQLDPNRLIGTYFTIARYPVKKQKHCVSDEMVLYALGDKRNTIQIVTTCLVKNDNSDSWNASGKFSKTGDGRIKLAWIWPFTTRYWVLALAPDYSWALVGSPNHKSVAILSHATTLPAATLAGIEAKATAQGFKTAKLIPIVQHPRPPVPPPTPAATLPTPAAP